MGRRSYEIMGPHWAASEGQMATAMNGKPKAVFSNTLQSADWGPVEVFGDPGAAIADLRARSDEGTILIHGGPTLAGVPVAIGAGLSPFSELGRHLKLELAEEQRFASGARGQILVQDRECALPPGRRRVVP